MLAHGFMLEMLFVRGSAVLQTWHFGTMKPQEGWLVGCQLGVFTILSHFSAILSDFFAGSPHSFDGIHLGIPSRSYYGGHVFI